VPPLEPRTVQYKPDALWDSTQYFGTGVGAIAKLGAEIGTRFSHHHGSEGQQVFGYSLVYCDSHGVNCFFVRNDIIGWSPQPGRKELLPVELVYRAPNYFAKGWTYKPDPQGRDWVWV
jgi:hypothetical protein